MYYINLILAHVKIDVGEATTRKFGPWQSCSTGFSVPESSYLLPSRVGAGALIGSIDSGVLA